MPAKPSSGYAYLTTPTHKHTPTHPHTFTHTHAQIDETIHNVGDSPATLLGNLFLFFLSPRHFTCCLLLDWLLSSSSSFGAFPLHLLYLLHPFCPSCMPSIPSLHPPFLLREPNSTFISTSHPVSAVDLCLRFRLHASSAPASAAVCARVNFGKIT